MQWVEQILTLLNGEERAYSLEEMLEARSLCVILIFPEPATTSFLCQITPALLQGALGREGWSISLCQPHSSWPHIIQLCWMVFSVPSSCNLPFLRHQLCFCANPILPDLCGGRAEGIRWGRRGGFPQKVKKKKKASIIWNTGSSSSTFSTHHMRKWYFSLQNRLHLLT